MRGNATLQNAIEMWLWLLKCGEAESFGHMVHKHGMIDTASHATKLTDHHDASSPQWRVERDSPRN
jgi:hypothetical protein